MSGGCLTSQRLNAFACNASSNNSNCSSNNNVWRAKKLQLTYVRHQRCRRRSRRGTRRRHKQCKRNERVLKTFTSHSNECSRKCDRDRERRERKRGGQAQQLHVRRNTFASFSFCAEGRVLTLSLSPLSRSQATSLPTLAVANSPHSRRFQVLC